MFRLDDAIIYWWCIYYIYGPFGCCLLLLSLHGDDGRRTTKGTLIIYNNTFSLQYMLTRRWQGCRGCVWRGACGKADQRTTAHNHASTPPNTNKKSFLTSPFSSLFSTTEKTKNQVYVL